LKKDFTEHWHQAPEQEPGANVLWQLPKGAEFHLKYELAKKVYLLKVSLLERANTPKSSSDGASASL
jgi:hypothetical protein